MYSAEISQLIHLREELAILKHFSEHRNRFFKMAHIFVHIPEIEKGLRISRIEIDGGAEQ